MKALFLLVVCVLLLACLQANYIVAEAKSHGEHHHHTDDAHREVAESRRWRMKHNKEKEHKEHTVTEKDEEKEKEPEDEAVDQPLAVDLQKLVNTDVKDTKAEETEPYNKMLGDQPQEQPQEESDNKRERKGERKEARKSRRQERRNKKKGREENQDEDRLTRKQQKKMERKQERKAKKAARKAEKMDKERPAEGEMTKAERKAARKAARQERKQARREGTGGKRQRKERTECSTESDCGDGECCIPIGRKNVKICHKSSGKPEGRSCSTSCTCVGDLQCYVTNERSERPDVPGHKRQKKIGSCTANPDLTMGKTLTAESYNQSPAKE